MRIKEKGQIELREKEAIEGSKEKDSKEEIRHEELKRGRKGRRKEAGRIEEKKDRK